MRNTLIFCLLLFSAISFSQVVNLENDDYLFTDTIQQHYFSFGISANYFKRQDLQSSPLLYQGALIGGNIAFESEGNKHKYEINLKGFYGNLSATTEYVIYPATEYTLNFNFRYVHSITRSDSKFRNFIGGQINNNALFYYNYNLQNASLNYSFLNNLALSYQVEHYFSWKSKTLKIWFLKINRRNRKIKLDFKFNLPIFFYNLRPPYSSISDFSNGENFIDIDSQSFFIFNNAFQINTNMNMTYYLSNNNAIRISYLWQGFKFTDVFNSYQSTEHILQFSLLFRLN